MFRNFKFTVLAAKLPKTSRTLKRVAGARIAHIPISLFMVVLLLALYLLWAINGSSVAKPAPPIYWSFEDGTLQGWQIVSDPSTAGPLIANHALFHNNPVIPYNKDGTYFLSTIEAPAGTCGNGYCDSYTVTLVSPQFTLGRPIVSMLVGGGNSSTDYVAACIYDTSVQYNCREVATARGINAESLQYRTLNLSNYLGQTVFFKVVDNNIGEWGHVTLDDVRANFPAIPTGLQVTHDNYGASLSWQADSESGVAGYNVYRSTTPNSNLIKLNSSPVTRVSYRDASAQPGTAYYYYVTTVGSDNIESEKSNTYSRAVEDLYTRGSTTTYSGNTLTQIDFPVGPIGGGGILHFDTAARNEGWIMNNGNYQDRYSGIVPNSFFAVRAQPQGGSAVVRALQTTPVGAFPAMADLTFQGEYPLATYNFQDSSLPIAVSESVDNPMIPGNLKDSAIPAAIYTLKFTNTSQNQVSVSLLASQQNAVGYDGSSVMGGTNNRTFSGYGSNTNSLVFDSNGGHLQMGGSNGSMTLSMLGSQTTGAASWDTLSNLESAFAATGSINGASSARSPQSGTTVDGALTRNLTLNPGATAQVTVILSWYFPMANRGWGGNGMYYTNYWGNAGAVDQYVTSNLASLQAQTQLYHDTLYSSNLPQYVLDRITSATAILHTPTMWWAQNGFFGGYEGYGCCDGMPNHVWHYAQADARLWPQIGQMIDQQWLNNENSDGSLPYRYTENRFAFDGQAGVILSTYRDYLNSQNTSWLTTYWPKIKGAMNYMVTSFDPNHNGILQGAALTTLDQTQPTMGPWLGSMYLAAVNASAHMASLVGDSADASLYQNIYTTGQTNQENMLWNGQLGYYVENPQNAGNAQHFVGNGMDIDMLLGQWWSTQLGLGDIYNSQHITLALKNLSKYNFKPNFVGNTPFSSYTYSHQWRDFVEPTDGGIVDTTWPNNDKPSNSIWYFDETQSGYEYAAATEMLQRGLLNQGLQAIKTLSDRYDGTLRNDPYLAFGNCGIGDATGNPFGDDECGKWYGRSMSSWSALLALQGFSYNASQGAIGFNPGWQPNNHKSFFTAANAWGTFNQQQNSNGTQSDSINLAYGTLSLKTITLAVPTGTSTSGWTVNLNGQNISGANIIVNGTTLTVTLPSTTDLTAGNTISVQGGTAQAPTPGVRYLIVNRNSGNALDDSGFASNDGATVVQYSAWGGPNQQWILIPEGDGYYEIVNRNSNKVLDDLDLQNSDPSNVGQWTANSGTNQEWSFVSLGSGYYKIINRFNGKALDDYQGNTSNNAPVVLGSNYGVPNQQWQLVPAS